MQNHELFLSEYNKAMEKYLKVVRFTFGLALMIAVGSVNALFVTPRSEWFALLLGMAIEGRTHSVCWLVVYLITAVHIGEATGGGPLKKCRPFLAGMVVLGSAWCFVFFRLHSMVGGLVLIFLCLFCVGFVFVCAVKRTKITALLSASLLAWYLYLSVIHVYLAAVN